MSWWWVILGILFFLAPVVLGAAMLAVDTVKRELTKQESIKKPVAQVPAPQVPSVPRWKRLATDRRIKTEQVEHDDYGAARSATRYSPCDWEPLPWTLTVWTDADEDAEIFALVSHRDVSEDDLRVSVLWSDAEPSEKDFRRNYPEQIERDERYQNRLIHRYEDERGTFRIEVDFQGDKVVFFHRPKAKQRPQNRLRNSAPVLPPPSPPNPFEDRLARFIRLQEQYEGAKERIRERKLPEAIESAALAELEEVYQDEVAAFEGEKRGGK